MLRRLRLALEETTSTSGGHTTTGTPYATRRNSTSFRGACTGRHYRTTSSIHTSAIRGASAADAAEGQLRCHFATGAMRAQRQGGQSLPGCPFLRVERAGRVGIAVFSVFGSGALSCCSSGVSGIEVLGRAGSLSSRLVGMNRSTARVIVCPGSSILDAINGFHSIHRPCEVRSGLWRTQDSSAGSFSFFCVVCPQQTNSASVQFCNIQLVLGKV